MVLGFLLAFFYAAFFVSAAGLLMGDTKKRLNNWPILYSSQTLQVSLWETKPESHTSCSILGEMEPKSSGEIAEESDLNCIIYFKGVLCLWERDPSTVGVFCQTKTIKVSILALHWKDTWIQTDDFKILIHEKLSDHTIFINVLPIINHK